MLRQVLVVESAVVKIGIDLRVPPKLRMETPQLWVDGRETELRMPGIVRSEHPQRIASGLETIATINELPLRLRLQWTGEKFPRYESTTHGTDAVFFNSGLSFLSMNTTIRARATTRDLAADD